MDNTLAFLSQEQIKISARKLKSLHHNNKKTAAAVSLVYVSDKQQGIQRRKKGKNFIYLYNGKKICDDKTIFRIRSLVIPPAWKNVWICRLDEGHLQATGFDQLGRKQYRYHPLWNALRNHTKFYRLLDFGNALPVIRKNIEKDISQPGLPLEKVLSVVVMLLEHTSIRIGNSFYEKLYGSFGLTTLKDQHVKINGNSLVFSFKGKKGVEQRISLNNKKLVKIVKQCRDIPGKELFQYYDENHHRQSIDSGMVNEYIKNISGGDFSAKDFRTWTGTVCALNAFKEMGCCRTETETKKNIVATLELVAKQLGNTRAVCKKYYVHPLLLDLYAAHKLERYFEPGIVFSERNKLKTEEQLLLHILSTEQATVFV